MVGPLIDAYAGQLSYSLSKSAINGVGLDTADKVQNLAYALDFMGSVAINLGYALQTFDYTTIAQDQNTLKLFQKY